MSRIVQKYQINVALRGLLIIAALAVAAGCGASNVKQVRDPAYADHGFRTLAIAPSDDLFSDDKLAEAVGAELARRGYSIVGMQEATALLAKYNVSSADMLAPQGLAALTGR